MNVGMPVRFVDGAPVGDSEGTSDVTFDGNSLFVRVNEIENTSTMASNNTKVHRVMQRKSLSKMVLKQSELRLSILNALVYQRLAYPPAPDTVSIIEVLYLQSSIVRHYSTSTFSSRLIYNRLDGKLLAGGVHH